MKELIEVEEIKEDKTAKKKALKDLKKAEKENRLKGYRSDLELYFSWWLDELLQEGLIEKYTYEKECFTLCSKTNLLNKCEYTPDFNIYTTSSQDIRLKELSIFPFIKCPTSDTYIIEIKPKFNYQNKNTEVVLKIKWLYSTQNIYVNIVKPVPTLFKGSFTPINYLYTDTTWNTDKKKDRKIEWEIKLLNEIIKQ